MRFELPTEHISPVRCGLKSVRRSSLWAPSSRVSQGRSRRCASRQWAHFRLQLLRAVDSAAVPMTAAITSACTFSLLCESDQADAVAVEAREPGRDRRRADERSDTAALAGRRLDRWEAPLSCAHWYRCCYRSAVLRSVRPPFDVSFYAAPRPDTDAPNRANLSCGQQCVTAAPLPGVAARSRRARSRG
jgi:hypothetical protein